MSDSFDKRLQALSDSANRALLNQSLKGVEKESLRITPTGRLAQTPHPRALGSALAHPYITTDYSEALLELITPPYADQDAALHCLDDVHRFIYHNIGEEMLWTTSMPCITGSDDAIPIAQYGSSNVGKMKHVYRVGLAYRYGRRMQAIAGMHFNYSMPGAFWPLLREIDASDNPLDQFIAENYFRLIRNFQRTGWLIPYLFGSSPAVCKSFLDGTPDLKELDKNTWYAPFGTSLRMSDIGYKNKAQADLNISYNDLETYIAGLTRAIETEDPEYAKIGVIVDGEYCQLNANVLQIENEYYSFIRPKNIAHSGEKPTLALRRRGVKYVEVRALDIDIFEPTGVSPTQIRFLESYLISSLLDDSPVISADEQREINHNQTLVACCGRDPDLKLRRRGKEVRLTDWAREIYTRIASVSELLDAGRSDSAYGQACELQLESIKDPDQTPSAKILTAMRDNRDSFFEFGMRMAEQHKDHFASRPLDAERENHFKQCALDSLAKQRNIEEADEISFAEYLENYFRQK
ncbi:MAG: glutamate--cysteine ligase [Gammaproteobacteria bacterium]|nr:glutamate--cysteine ligase [Gammaproteobacteria bacterium]